MAGLADLAAVMGSRIDPMVLMQRVTDRTLELIGSADGVMVGLADGAGVRYVCGAGNQGAYVGTRVDLDASLSGLAVRTGELQFCADTEADGRVDLDACRRLSVVSLVCVPLARHDGALGVLAVNATTANAFTTEDIAALTGLAEFMSFVVGSACDLTEVTGRLLDAHAGAELTAEQQGAKDAASRYVMSVLSHVPLTGLSPGTE